MQDTSIVLINYNNHSDTLNCLASIADAGFMNNVVVVDNCSTIPGLDNLKRRFSKIKLIKNDRNIGFGRANNVGIRWILNETKCKSIFLLNNDTIIHPHTIPRLESAMKEFPKAGITCPRIVMLEDPSILWYGGADVDWTKGSIKSPGYLRSSCGKLALTARDVSFASGCAMLIKKEVFERIGGFDPRFFMYVEDLEFCLRVKKSGWTIRYVPGAVVQHKCQGSLRRNKKFRPIDHPLNPRLGFTLYNLTRNRLLIIFIHAKGKNLLKFCLIFPVYMTAKCIQYLLHKRWDAMQAIAKGFRDFIKICGEPFKNEIISE